MNKPQKGFTSFVVESEFILLKSIVKVLVLLDLLAYDNTHLFLLSKTLLISDVFAIRFKILEIQGLALLQKVVGYTRYLNAIL